MYILLFSITLKKPPCQVLFWCLFEKSGIKITYVPIKIFVEKTSNSGLTVNTEYSIMLTLVKQFRRTKTFKETEKMAYHTFTVFQYNDESQKLAQALFHYSRIKDKKVYAVERMDIDGLEKNNSSIAEFFVIAETERHYRQKKTADWQTLDEFWTADRVFARSCPHWERRSIQVSVGIGLRGDTGENPIIQKLVSFHTWYDNKYKSQADGIARSMVGDDYDETASQVRADWNDNVITDGSVEMNSLQNGVGIMWALSDHIKQQRTAKDKEILDIFAKIKV